MKAPFLYFFKGATSKTYPEEMKFRFKEHLTHRRCHGPDGQGLIAAPFSDIEPPFYDRENYTWHKIKELWLGVRKNIDPAELMVEKPIEKGYMVELGDENKWLLPVAMLDAPNFSLPCYEAMNEDGDWIWKVVEKYDFLTFLAEKVWESVDDDGNFEMDEDFLRKACCAALGINYNITEMEAGAMKLLTQEAYQRIVSALIDIDGKREILAHIEDKKKLSEDKNTSSGKQD